MLVLVSYRVAPADAQAFVARMRELRVVRLRDGAVDWVLERDLADPERFVEEFHVRSWQEHLRQHERLTKADLPLEREIRELGAGGGQPPVTHLVEVEGQRPGAHALRPDSSTSTRRIILKLIARLLRQLDQGPAFAHVDPDLLDRVEVAMEHHALDARPGQLAQPGYVGGTIV